MISSAGFIIALGVIILILTAVGKYDVDSIRIIHLFVILGFLGAYKNRLSLLKIFIGSLILILLLQLIASIVAFTLRNKAEDQLRTKLIKTLPEYEKNPSVKKEWDHLQQKWRCCGVTNSSDWEDIAHVALPKSCCANNDCTQSSPSTKYTAGCYQSALNLFFRYSKTLGVVTLIFFLIEVAGLVLSIQLLRDLKNNYGSV